MIVFKQSIGTWFQFFELISVFLIISFQMGKVGGTFLQKYPTCAGDCENCWFFFFFKNTIVFLFFNTHPHKLFQDFVEIHCVLTSQSWSGVCNAYLLRSQLYNCPRNGIVGLFLTRNHTFFSFTNLNWLDGKRLLESGLMLGLNHYI